MTNILEEIEKALPVNAKLDEQTGYTRIAVYKTFYKNKKPNRFIVITALQMLKNQAIKNLEIIAEAEKQLNITIAD